MKGISKQTLQNNAQTMNLLEKEQYNNKAPINNEFVNMFNRRNRYEKIA